MRDILNIAFNQTSILAPNSRCNYEPHEYTRNNNKRDELPALNCPKTFYEQAYLKNLNSNVDNKIQTKCNKYTVLQPPLMQNLPEVNRIYNFIGIEKVDPKNYIAEHASELINHSKLPNLEITKWAHKNIALPRRLRLVSKSHIKNTNPLSFRC